MAQNNQRLKSLRPKRCLADRPERTKAAAAAAPWSYYISSLKVAILGPADHQWFAASKPYYTGRVGSVPERDIAERAVAILNRDHAGDETIARPQIDNILQRAARERKQAAAERRATAASSIPSLP